MQEKKLAREELVTSDGCMCAVGVIASARGIDVSKLDPDDSEDTPVVLAQRLRLAESMVREIIYINDEGMPYGVQKTETPEERWARVRSWVAARVND